MSELPPITAGSESAPLAWSDAELDRMMVEAAAQGVLVLDMAGDIRYASPSSESIVGLPVEQVLGTSVFDYVEPGEVALAIEAWESELAHPNLDAHAVEIHLRGPLGYRTANSSRELGWRLYEVKCSTLPERGEIVMFLWPIGAREAVHDILGSIMRYEPLAETLEVVVALAFEQLQLTGAAVSHPKADGDVEVVAQGVDEAGIRSLAEGRDPTAVSADKSSKVHQVPLGTPAGGVIGNLTMWWEDGMEYAPNDMVYVQRLARLAAFAIDRSHRDRVLAHAAEHDPLTEALNRSAFIAELEDARRTEPGARSAVLFVDLDGFKRVNDEHGHTVGDQVLVAVANRMRKALRGGDLVARLGGDEFAVLCDAVTDRAAVLAIADRLIESVRRPIFVGDRAILVGASVGIAFDGGTGLTADDMLGRADAALYRAKRSGKGCWRVADDQSTMVASND